MNYKMNNSFKSHNLKILETNKYGKGVFAGKDIKKGQIIGVLGGEIINFEECTKRIISSNLIPDDPLSIGNGFYIILDPISYFFNHSCKPNAGLRKRSELFALRNIKKGEEITYDYSTTVDPGIKSDLWTMKCNCGSKNCRKVLGNIYTIPQEQLNKYKKIGALQDFMKMELRKKYHKNVINEVIKIKNKINGLQSSNKN